MFLPEFETSHLKIVDDLRRTVMDERYENMKISLLDIHFHNYVLAKMYCRPILQFESWALPMHCHYYHSAMKLFSKSEQSTHVIYQP